jgi:transposase
MDATWRKESLPHDRPLFRDASSSHGSTVWCHSAILQRHLVEGRFSKLKQFRRVATRFEKTARHYLTVVTLAATIPWLR